MFSDFPKIFDKSFVISYLIPSVILSLGFIGLLSAFGIADLPSYLTDTNPIIGTAVIALSAWVIGILFMGANRDIVRVLEGYGKFNPLRKFLEAEKNKFNDLQKKISQLEDKARKKEISEDEEDELNQLFLESVTKFPDEEKFVLPTSFGNAIRAFEVYPRLMYGAESIVLWSRLLTVVPEEYKSHISDAKAHMDFWVNLGVTSWLLFSASILERIYVWYINIPVIPALFWLLLLVELAILWVCQFRATRSAVLWGQTVKSAFDVYLPDLAKKLGLKLPKTHQEIKNMWQEYCIAIQYARDDHFPEFIDPTATAENSKEAK